MFIVKIFEINNLKEESTDRNETIHIDHDLKEILQKEMDWLKNQIEGTQHLVEVKNISWEDIVTNVFEMSRLIIIIGDESNLIYNT